MWGDDGLVKGRQYSTVLYSQKRFLFPMTCKQLYLASIFLFLNPGRAIVHS